MYAVTGMQDGNMNNPMTSLKPDKFLANLVYLLADAGI